MNEIFGQIRDYLPKFLSSAAQAELFRELEQFPDNIDSRIYSQIAKGSGEIYQGDGVCRLPVVNLPSSEMKEASCLILSNSCDISPANDRYLDGRIAYCPIVPLRKLKRLIEQVRPRGVEDIMTSIRRQRLTTMFYLPVGGGVLEDSVAMFDHPLNCALTPDTYRDFAGRKAYSLSNYGFYLFLFKISVHMTRIADAVDRGAGEAPT